MGKRKTTGQPKKLDRSQLMRAASRIKSGATWRAVAESVGMSPLGLRTAIRRELPEEEYPGPKNHRKKTKSEAPEDSIDDLDPVPDAVPDTAPPEGTSIQEQRTFFAQLRNSSMATARSLEASGEIAEARKYTDAAMKAAAVLARLSKGEAAGYMTLNLDDIRAARARARQKIDNFVATKRPLLCAKCMRELSVEWADDDET